MDPKQSYVRTDVISNLIVLMCIAGNSLYIARQLAFMERAVAELNFLDKSCKQQPLSVISVKRRA